MNAEQLRKHPFFYGVDWETIRDIDAPFVPHLRSITDTSYFPTEDLDQAPEEPASDSSAAGKDLAFLGYVPSYSCFSFKIRISFRLARYTFKRFSISSHAF